MLNEKRSLRQRSSNVRKWRKAETRNSSITPLVERMVRRRAALCTERCCDSDIASVSRTPCRPASVMNPDCRSCGGDQHRLEPSPGAARLQDCRHAPGIKCRRIEAAATADAPDHGRYHRPPRQRLAPGAAEPPARWLAVLGAEDGLRGHDRAMLARGPSGPVRGRQEPRRSTIAWNTRFHARCAMSEQRPDGQPSRARIDGPSRQADFEVAHRRMASAMP